MARMTFKAGDEYAVKLSKLAAGSDAIAKKAIYQGAKIVADRTRLELRRVISQTKNSKSTGDLEASLGITPIQRDENGWNAKIGFDGYDRKGVPNALKARVLESGSSRQPKRPFVRPAVNATKQKAIEVMNQTVDEEIRKTMGG